MSDLAFDPGTAKMVILFGGAAVVAVVGLWRNARQQRAFEQRRRNLERLGDADPPER